MCFFFSLIPATVWLVVGYFVLFSSTKTQGAVQKFGQNPGDLGVHRRRVFSADGRLCDDCGPLSAGCSVALDVGRGGHVASAA